MPARAAPLSSLQVGQVGLTWLPDGIHHVRPLEQYDNGSPALWAESPHVIDDDGWLVMSIGGLLVRSVGRCVLIDLGFGPRAVHDIAPLTGGQHHGDMYGGELLASLRQAGLSPADIDAVVISHMHPDHLGWVATERDGEPVPVFPSAQFHLGAREWEYWQHGPEANTPKAPAKTQMQVIGDRLCLMSDGDSPVPGVTAMETPGHTPGHMSFVVSSGTERAIVLGDAIHCPVEIGAPQLDFVFDVDPRAARQAKETILRELEKPETHLVGGHFPQAVFGRLILGEGRHYVKLYGTEGGS
jgi:glyoxylase-like metal-dependent hydrolase (beta-lactamase superfamily II)